MKKRVGMAVTMAMLLLLVGGCLAQKTGGTSEGVQGPTVPSGNAKIIIKKDGNYVSKSIFGGGPQEALGSATTAVFVRGNQTGLYIQQKEAVKTSGGTVSVTLSPLKSAATTFEAIELEGTNITAVAVCTVASFNAGVAGNTTSSAAVTLSLTKPAVTINWATTSAIYAGDGSSPAAFSWADSTSTLKYMLFNKATPTIFGKYYAYSVTSGTSLTSTMTAFTSGDLVSTTMTPFSTTAKNIPSGDFGKKLYIVLKFEYANGGTSASVGNPGTTKYYYTVTSQAWDIVGGLGLGF